MVYKETLQISPSKGYIYIYKGSSQTDVPEQSTSFSHLVHQYCVIPHHPGPIREDTQGGVSLFKLISFVTLVVTLFVLYRYENQILFVLLFVVRKILIDVLVPVV